MKVVFYGAGSANLGSARPRVGLVLAPFHPFVLSQGLWVECLCMVQRRNPGTPHMCCMVGPMRGTFRN